MVLKEKNAYSGFHTGLMILERNRTLGEIFILSQTGIFLFSLTKGCFPSGVIADATLACSEKPELLYYETQLNAT